MSCNERIKGPIMAATLSHEEAVARQKFRDSYLARRDNDNDLPRIQQSMKPTTVHIRKTRHKDQPWTVTIQPPGKAEAYTIKQRYARPFTAKRGAVRHLGGYIHRQWNWKTCKYRTLDYKMQDGSPIVFK